MSNPGTRIKKTLRVKHVGFVVKNRHEEAHSLAVELASFLLDRRVSICFADEARTLARHVKKSCEIPMRSKSVRVMRKPELVERCDLIVVLGGDGTFLSIARLMKSRSVPVMGINMGRLGFLTETTKEEALDGLARILDKGFVEVSERALLEVTLMRNRKVVFRGPVVNDAVISKGAIARIIGLQIRADGRQVNDVRADGIIVSTPTGSTAYSLAAGGPILEPSVPALIINPICPHSLTHRALVLSDSMEIQIRLQDRPGHVLLTLDGQDAVDMKENDVVVIRRFRRHSLQLVASQSRDYFSVIREKLKFGLSESREIRAGS
ncbi:MAG: NAD(+)/NADH kinase [Bdellovibrionales bacterium]|nr:NAD(+)/NADH kinase [Bdellovibrionales bacterium]